MIRRLAAAEERYRYLAYLARATLNRSGRSERSGDTLAPMANSPRTVHVVPHGSGWAIRAASGRASKTFASQAEAVKAAQASVREGGGQLVVQAPNGRIRKSFTLGRAAMEKLNAVEGLKLAPATKKAFRDFDRNGLSPTQRRAQLRKDVGKISGAPKAGAPSRRNSPSVSKG